jgi:hypothetical protein
MVLMEGGSARVPEGVPAQRSVRFARLRAFAERQRVMGVCGGFLIGMSTFQAEFDFGVPQFRMYFQPVLIAIAAGTTLVAARIYGGRGSALLAVLWFWLIRGTVTLLVGPVLGESTAHLPLYVIEAGVVELAALAVGTRRAYRFGALSGLGIATAGFAAEYAWSHIWMPLPWPGRIVGEVAIWLPVAAVAAGLLGAFVGTALRAPLDGPRARLPHPALAGAALAAVCVVVAHGLATSPQKDVRTQVALRTLTPGPDRTVAATVRIDPPAAARDADWLTVTAWQGHGFVVDRLARVRDGVFRTTRPIPVHGSWKAMVRLHKGSSLLAAPIYLPEDRAIPAEGVPATPAFTRPMVADKRVLQREAKQGVGPGLWTFAYSVVGSIALVLVLLLGWAMARLVGGARGERTGDGPRGAAGRGAEPRLPAPGAV